MFGLQFAAAVGAVEKHREDHLLLDLPVPTAPVDPAYDVVTWRGRCPDEHREAYLAMRNQMNADVPVGELDLEPTVLDDARLASSEERLMRSYDVRVAAARHPSGAHAEVPGLQPVWFGRADLRRAPGATRSSAGAPSRHHVHRCSLLEPGQRPRLVEQRAGPLLESVRGPLGSRLRDRPPAPRCVRGPSRTNCATSFARAATPTFSHST